MNLTSDTGLNTKQSNYVTIEIQCPTLISWFDGWLAFNVLSLFRGDCNVPFLADWRCVLKWDKDSAVLSIIKYWNFLEDSRGDPLIGAELVFIVKVKPVTQSRMNDLLVITFLSLHQETFCFSFLIEIDLLGILRFNKIPRSHRVDISFTESL